MLSFAEGGYRRLEAHGFTLLETIAAMIVLLMGLLGIFAVFGSGVHARLQAQELIISQDLASQWAEWIRFRLNDCETTPEDGARGILRRDRLQKHDAGDFYEDTGDHHFLPPGDVRNLPTFKCSIYRGYRWEIMNVNHNYKPQWRYGLELRDWDVRGDRAPVVPPSMELDPMKKGLFEVELAISRGARRYPFTFAFSGVGLKYD
jgi:type II secretory pathway pseudopilin PulG